MIWRRGKRLVEQLRPISFQVTKIQSLASIHNLSSQIQSATRKHQCLQDSSRFSKSILTPQIVHKTLKSCPSDLIALNFFLWCAKQPNYFHDKLTFQHMVNVVARLTEKFKAVKGVIKELEYVGSVIKPQTLLLLLRIYWCGGMYALVFEAFEQMFVYGYTPNTFARNIVVDVFFKIGRVEVALRVLKETKVPNFLSFSIAVCNLCKLNDLVNMKDVLRIMLREGYYLNSETFFMVLSCYCKLGRLAETLQLLGLIITLGVQISVNVWSMLIHAFCKSGRLDVAASLLEKMVESGYPLDIVACTPLVKGFLESEMPGKAFELLNTMESMRCQPDLVLCNVLIDRLSKMGRYGDALDVFSSLQERRLIPDAYTFSSMLSAVCLSRQFVILPMLIDGLSIEPDLVACNALISYYCKAGYPSGAVEFYEDMTDRGYIPDNYSFAGLLSALCKLGRIDEAVNVYTGIIRGHFGLDANVHTVIFSGLVNSGNFNRAARLFREAVAQKFPLDVVSYTVAINGLLRNGQAEEAYGLFIQMKEVGIAPNLQTYKLMLSGFCKHKDVKMVRQMLLQMADAGIEMDFTTIRSMKTLLTKLPHSSSISSQFIQLLDSGLIATKEYSVLIAGLFDGAYASDSLQADAVDVMDVGMSRLDDCCDSVVSAG